MADRPRPAASLALPDTAATSASAAAESNHPLSPSLESIGSSPDPGAPPRATLRRERLLLALALTLLLAVVGPPLINLGRYQHKIAASMSRSLGREVSMQAVSLRLLPVPALVLTDVIVNEEAGFGAEPALRAPTVVAQPRLVSLWRGRLEISRVELSDASLNLVRDQAGRWNVGSVLLQASHVANAPTGQRRSGPAPRFPYIQITDSRINVKQGVEKLPYSLLNANLSMWLAEPDLWQLRLEGQPVRTDIDLGLSDTGTLRVQGKLHRATALGRMPLALHAEWTNAPLGQASRLLLGQDRGWRGDLHAAADVAGDLDSLDAKTHITLTNLHREEFSPLEPFTVDATCRAVYSRAARTLRDLACRWPIGRGQLLLTGNLSAGNEGAGSLAEQTPAPTSALALTADQLPASFLVAAAGLARSDFVPAFHLEGALSGTFFYNASGKAGQYTGMVEAPQLRLEADGLQQPLEIGHTRITVATPRPSGLTTLVLTTAPVDLGGAAPAEISAQSSLKGFLLHAGGVGSLSRIEALGRATHLLPAAMAWLAAQGTAEFDVTRQAGWQDGELAGAAAASGTGLQATPPSNTAPITNGWLRLHNVQYAPPFLAEPATVASAQANFSPGRISWTVPSALIGQTSLQVTATYPLDCAAEQGCVTRFEASCATLDGDGLASTLLGNSNDSHLFDQLMSRLDKEHAHWPRLAGTVHAGVLTLGRLALRNATAELSMADGHTSIRSLDAQALGGALHAEGTVAVTAAMPSYALSLSLKRANAAAAGMLFREDWGSGLLDFSSHIRLAGFSAAQLAASAAGDYHAEWARGGLGAETPLRHFALWTADGTIGNQTLILSRGELTGTGASASASLTGSIGFDRTLALHVQAAKSDSSAPRPSVSVTGTLSQPIEAEQRP